MRLARQISIADGRHRVGHFGHRVILDSGDRKAMVAQFLAALLTRCPARVGVGALGGKDNDHHEICAVCSGTGSKLAGATEVFEQAAAQIEATFPGLHSQSSILIL